MRIGSRVKELRPDISGTFIQGNGPPVLLPGRAAVLNTMCLQSSGGAAERGPELRQGLELFAGVAFIWRLDCSAERTKQNQRGESNCAWQCHGQVRADAGAAGHVRRIRHFGGHSQRVQLGRRADAAMRPCKLQKAMPP